jgi:hypothetical protein
MDESIVVRAKAVQAWQNVPYDLTKNFPDLFFESFAVLLADSYVHVHQSVVHSLRRRPFPKEKRGLLMKGMLGLIICYSQKRRRHDSFIVDCIDVFIYLDLAPKSKDDATWKYFSGILLSLEGDALYTAINRLHYKFNDIPGFTKVALKAIQDNYTRSISTDDCKSAIANAPTIELQNCEDDIRKALENLKPFRLQNFSEALLYIAVLSRAGFYITARDCILELTESIPKEDRTNLWRLESSLVATALEIESAIGRETSTSDYIRKWKNTLAELEKENEERSELRDFPPSFFFEG